MKRQLEKEESQGSTSRRGGVKGQRKKNKKPASSSSQAVADPGYRDREMCDIWTIAMMLQLMQLYCAQVKKYVDQGYLVNIQLKQENWAEITKAFNEWYAIEPFLLESQLKSKITTMKSKFCKCLESVTLNPEYTEILELWNQCVEFTKRSTSMAPSSSSSLSQAIEEELLSDATVHSITDNPIILRVQGSRMLSAMCSDGLLKVNAATAAIEIIGQRKFDVNWISVFLAATNVQIRKKLVRNLLKNHREI